MKKESIILSFINFKCQSTLRISEVKDLAESTYNFVACIPMMSHLNLQLVFLTAMPSSYRSVWDGPESYD